MMVLIILVLELRFETAILVASIIVGPVAILSRRGRFRTGISHVFCSKIHVIYDVI